MIGVLVFFLLSRRPRTFPLFPYTTLFRSISCGALEGSYILDPFFPATPSSDELPEDRKSTRLNSSHLGISYAVFCLKKKKLAKPPIETTEVVAGRIRDALAQVPHQHYMPA